MARRTQHPQGCIWKVLPTRLHLPELGDSTCEAAYEQALQRSLRSLRQLQFRDQYDTYYISKKNRVLGALRTEAYDNTIRVDSAAHALLAAVKILRPMEFGLVQSKSGSIAEAFSRTMLRLNRTK